MGRTSARRNLHHHALEPSSLTDRQGISNGSLTLLPNLAIIHLMLPSTHKETEAQGAEPSLRSAVPWYIPALAIEALKLLLRLLESPMFIATIRSLIAKLRPSRQPPETKEK
ncbi:hypothetical protein ES705_29171 [subsurface metagenome]